MNILNDNEKSILTGLFNDIFDTLTEERSIIVYKEPIKVQNPISISQGFVFGFGNEQSQDGFTYQQVTGIFPAIVKYDIKEPFELLAEAYSKVPQGQVTIKVRSDCKDFINLDKTEKIVIDNRAFSIVTEEKRQCFLDTDFWMFTLQSIK